MKRYVETERWFDPFFTELSLEAKVFYSYLADRCNNAGIYERNDRVARTCINRDLDFDAIIEELGDRVEKLKSGKLWLTRFIKVQLNGKPLRPDKIPAHAQIVKFLKDEGIGMENPWVARGIGVQTEKPKAEKKRAEQPALPGLENAVTFPPALDCREFHETWELWLKYRRERKLPALQPTSIKAQLDELATWGLERAIMAVKHSIRQNWQGIFEEKSNGRTTTDRNRSSRSFEHGSDYGSVKEKL
jgi:hypothetical protein